MNTALIVLILATLIGLTIGGWLYSPRTRRIAVFFIIIVLGLAVLIGLITLARILWFPVGPM